MIQEVDKPGSEISTYIEGLETVLDQHMHEISTLQAKLKGFREKLKREHELSKICQIQNENAENKEPNNQDPHFETEDLETPDEPRSRIPRVQQNLYEFQGQRGSNYKP